MMSPIDPLAVDALHAKIAQLEERLEVVANDYDRVHAENSVIRPRLHELEADNAMLRGKLEHYAKCIRVCDKCEYRPHTEVHAKPADTNHDLWHA